MAKDEISTASRHCETRSAEAIQKNSKCFGLLRAKALAMTFVLLRLFIFPTTSYPQSSCPNFDFSMGDFTNWRCFWEWRNRSALVGSGSFDTCQCSKFRYTLDIVTTDDSVLSVEHTPNCPPFVPPDGYNFFAFLEGSGYGYPPIVNADTVIDAVALEYDMTIDSSNSYVMLYLAWKIFYRYGCGQITIQLKDSTGNILIVPCGNMDIRITD